MPSSPPQPRALGPIEIVHGIELESAEPLTQRMLPLAILIPGFSFNTLFYAAILWLLICGPFVLRRFIRVKRGLCPACAYPMGDSAVCTECGKAVRKRAVS